MNGAIPEFAPDQGFRDHRMRPALTVLATGGPPAVGGAGAPSPTPRRSVIVQGSTHTHIGLHHTVRQIVFGDKQSSLLAAASVGHRTSLGSDGAIPIPSRPGAVLRHPVLPESQADTAVMEQVRDAWQRGQRQDADPTTRRQRRKVVRSSDQAGRSRAVWEGTVVIMPAKSRDSSPRRQAGAASYLRPRLVWARWLEECEYWELDNPATRTPAPPGMPVRALEPDEEFFIHVEALERELGQLRLTLPEEIDDAVEARRLTQTKADEWMPWAVAYDPRTERAELTGYLADVDIRLPLINARIFGAFERMQVMADLLQDVRQDVYPRLPRRLLRG